MTPNVASDVSKYSSDFDKIILRFIGSFVGIALSVEQWNKLKDQMEEIDDALEAL